ncbi:MULTISPECIES: ectoine/hydroxyectoine ABC transporter ATP-binding protein EhuA [Streptomyces]|uniref:Ectoine/hydroxyectoine ABC transporter ATP-binding protein EhuA n=1 Tax=Streptomyces glycanivorans TaxID=3033808 RepID=A0ABY9JHI3_9ACTN|nr:MULTISPECIES: ectoine/hydroxyectoine ABC transporter ATP-binding protein EhuA [unclassified Streptomyces]WSQ79695.1 ectoine/hydroxyectoine ABC transporter ATP-binding protein EhuA [Streptomyces sp. NBC_01213]TXS09126.1 ectoine/hydroxyectoine ABC transporter ATP-binding protein EhuA [Streptomyces sp. wa22]WLQ66249.1 ectoine/hydroxyectoine ABC transporter ATP-binding protein EhuA [Streptomyces sp. Alt3]WSQ87075.1 ectoine/hydroxyectoine ABC transporter ATP-binding protein EhuA [Streptomyces sp.
MATEPAPLEKIADAAGDPLLTGVEPLVRFDRVVKRYGDHVVLDELDFSVRRGEHVTLIGPSGSGKTTILRLLMTLEKVSDGVIWVDGSPLSHVRRPDGSLKPAGEKELRESRKKIGMVFQQFNLFPNMKVLQNITEAPVNVLGMDKDEAESRARELLDLVGLSGKVDAHPSQLSGGQQQRVAIARALAMRPEILLLDEVTSALDPELVAGVLDLLGDIARTTDITMLCVTHEMNFARDVSETVLMFDAGRVVESGSPEKIFTDPEHERTREFLNAVL